MREKWVENVFKEIPAKSFPNLRLDLDIQFMKLVSCPKFQSKGCSARHNTIVHN